MGTTLMDTPLLILCMAAKREPLMLKFITLPTEYCLLDTLDTTIPTHTFCMDVRREKLMLNLMLIPRLMLMLLHGTEFMDIGPDITPGTTTTPDIHITGMENKSTRERLFFVTVKITSKLRAYLTFLIEDLLP